MSVFEYNDYKEWVNDWVASQPRKGFGIYSRMAEFLGTNSVVISQVFKGDRELGLEQCHKLSQFMNLATLEADFLLLLVQRQRAGTYELKQVFTRQLNDLRSRGQAIKNRIQHDQLSDEDKSQFYSTWYFVATWLAATIPKYSSMKELSLHFNVPESVLRETLQFLLDKELLIKKGNGFDFGTNVIHVPHDSLYSIKHHMNWRVKAMQSMDQRRESNLHYSAPMAMSDELKIKIREDLVQLIQKQTKRVADSPSEALMCLNIDFFEF